MMQKENNQEDSDFSFVHRKIYNSLGEPGYILSKKELKLINTIKSNLLSEDNSSCTA